MPDDELTQAREEFRRCEARSDWDGALKAANLAIYHGTDPREIAAMYLAKAGILAGPIGRADKAEQHLSSAVEHDPTLSAAWVRYVDMALARADWAAAASRAVEAVRHLGTGREGLWLLECVSLGGHPRAAVEGAALRVRIPESPAWPAR